MKIDFISFENTIHKFKEKWLVNTAQQYGVNIKFIGRDSEHGKSTKWNGFIDKLKTTKKYLESIDSELVCVLDSRDTLIAATEDLIYDTFINTFSKDTVIFNGETNCYPDSSLAELHPMQDKKYKYLNAGACMGNRELLITLYENAIELYNDNGRGDDQLQLQTILISNKFGDNFTIDYDCNIFQCIWDENYGRNNNFDLVYTKDCIYNRLTKTIPLIFHYPGPTCVGSQAYKVITKNYYSLIDNTYINKKV